MGASAIRAGRAFVEVGGDNAPLKAVLARVRADLLGFAGGIATVGSGLTAIGGGVLGALAWPLKLAADLETTRAAFTSLLKDAAKAEALLSDIQKLGASTPFEFPELATAARKLLAFQIPAEKIIETLTQIGDVASAIDAPISEIAELFGKARVQGRLFGEDINQLTGRGIPVLGELAKQFGVTEDKVKGLVEAGQVSFKNLEIAFRDLTTGVGIFAGGMEAKSRTLAGRWSTLKDNVKAAVLPIGNALLPVVGRIVGQLSTMAALLGAVLEKNAQWGVYIGAAAAGMVALGGTLASVGFAVIGISSALGFVASSVGAVFALLTSLGAAAAAVASSVGLVGLGVAAALGLAASRIGALRETLGAAFQAVGQWASSFQNVNDAAATLQATFGSVFGTIRAAWAAVAAAVADGRPEAALEITAAAFQVIWLQMVAGLRKAWAELTGGIRDSWTDAVTFVGKLGVNAFANLQAGWARMVQFFADSFDIVGTGIRGVLDWLYTRFSQLGVLFSKLVGNEKAATQIAEFESERQARAAGRGGDLTESVGNRQRATDAKVNATIDRAAAYFNELDKIAALEKAARRDVGEAGINAAQARLRDAQGKLANIVSEGAAATETEKKKQVLAATAGAAKAGNLGSAGAFNPAALRSLGIGTGGIADRTAKATERTAENTARLVDKADRGIIFG